MSSGGFGKDQDMRRRVRMDSMARVAMSGQIALDVEFLERWGLMDYSMLLGVHVCSPACNHDLAICACSVHVCVCVCVCVYVCVYVCVCCV